MNKLCVVLVALAACGQDATLTDPPSSTPAVQEPVRSAYPGNYKLGCEAEIVTHCPKGMKWGCMGGLTLTHACIPEASQPGPPCSAEVALECPAGQIDGCELQPPIASKHLCVYDPAAYPPAAP